MLSSVTSQPSQEQACGPAHASVPPDRSLHHPLHPTTFAQALRICRNTPRSLDELLSISYDEILSWRRTAPLSCKEKELKILNSTLSYLTSCSDECSQNPWPTDKHKQKHGKFVNDTKGTILFLTVIDKDTNVILFTDTFESKKSREGDHSNKNDKHAEAILRNNQSTIKTRILTKLHLLQHKNTRITVAIQIKNSPCNECAPILVNFANYLESSAYGGPLIIGPDDITINYIQLYRGQKEGLGLLDKDDRFKIGLCQDHSVQLFGAVAQWESLSETYNESKMLTVSIFPLCQSVESLCDPTQLKAFLQSFVDWADRSSVDEIKRKKTNKQKRQAFLSLQSRE